MFSTELHDELKWEVRWYELVCNWCGKSVYERMSRYEAHLTFDRCDRCGGNVFLEDQGLAMVGGRIPEGSRWRQLRGDHRGVIVEVDRDNGRSVKYHPAPGADNVARWGRGNARHGSASVRRFLRDYEAVAFPVQPLKVEEDDPIGVIVRELAPESWRDRAASRESWRNLDLAEYQRMMSGTPAPSEQQPAEPARTAAQEEPNGDMSTTEEVLAETDVPTVQSVEALDQEPEQPVEVPASVAESIPVSLDAPVVEPENELERSVAADYAAGLTQHDIRAKHGIGYERLLEIKNRLGLERPRAIRKIQNVEALPVRGAQLQTPAAQAANKATHQTDEYRKRMSRERTAWADKRFAELSPELRQEIRAAHRSKVGSMRELMLTYKINGAVLGRVLAEPDLVVSSEPPTPAQEVPPVVLPTYAAEQPPADAPEPAPALLVIETYTTLNGKEGNAQTYRVTADIRKTIEIDVQATSFSEAVALAQQIEGLYEIRGVSRV